MPFPGTICDTPSYPRNQDFRGFAGRIDGGVFKPGDRVKTLPSGFVSTIKTIELNGEQIAEAFAPMSVTMTLQDEIDTSRGDMIVRENNVPEVGQDLEILVTWMSSTPLKGAYQGGCKTHHQPVYGDGKRVKVQGRYQHLAPHRGH